MERLLKTIYQGMDAKHFQVTETSRRVQLNPFLKTGSNAALVSLTRAGRPHKPSYRARRSTWDGRDICYQGSSSSGMQIIYTGTVHSFACVAPRLWDSIPLPIRSTPLTDCLSPSLLLTGISILLMWLSLDLCLLVFVIVVNCCFLLPVLCNI